MRLPGQFATSLAVAAIGLSVAWAHDADAAKLAGRNVKIGCMVPLTGKGAEWGQTAKISMEIAADEINKKGGVGGVPISLICYDTQTLEAEGLKAISRLVERDKVLAISGPCFSSVFETIAPQLDTRFKTVMNSYCSAKPGLSAMSKWAFRNTLTSDKQLKPVVEAWVKEYKPKKVVIIYDAEDAVSKGEGAGVLPNCSRRTASRCSTTDVSHQGHRLFSAGHQGQVAWRRRHRARRLLPECRGHRQGDAETRPQCPDRRRCLRRRPGLHRDRRQSGRRSLHVDGGVDRRSAPRGAGLPEEVPGQEQRQGSHPTAARAPTTSSTPSSTASRPSGVTNKPADLDSDRDKIRGCLAGSRTSPASPARSPWTSTATAQAQRHPQGGQRQVRQRPEITISAGLRQRPKAQRMSPRRPALAGRRDRRLSALRRRRRMA